MIKSKISIITLRENPANQHGRQSGRILQQNHVRLVNFRRQKVDECEKLPQKLQQHAKKGRQARTLGQMVHFYALVVH